MCHSWLVVERADLGAFSEMGPRTPFQTCLLLRSDIAGCCVGLPQLPASYQTLLPSLLTCVCLCAFLPLFVPPFFLCV